MPTDIQTTLRRRVLTVFSFVHLGLVLAVFGLARLSFELGFRPSVVVMAAGLGLLYFGVVLGGFFLVWPLLPWFQRAQEARKWGSHALEDLPQLLALSKKIMVTLKPLLQSLLEQQGFADHKSTGETKPSDQQAA